ncbi:heme ABC exporter ATP-binding protein CcmA [Cytobacillus dafuensis]|uniref:Heme ABC exporter ATP-binding protein CcmA n=1 Tax=Cytobacillus dafuensis TaxID=1742359 RepID=A0A5B8ZBI5_CYTDA|nr:heme ABC exporter ATP-binding protein CcmA [Cytobacillus dafuensis]QED49029.1 heme ABC exporter ATP-binding protein CcmA [Cytobacillus dafuensis]
MLELKNMTKIIGDRIIIRNLSLAIEPGESVAILGPNGAGKSTFFKLAAGLMQPTSGDIYLNGELIKKKSQLLKQKIGYLGHESFLYTALTPLENLLFYAKLYKVKNREEKAMELLKAVGLHYFKDIPIRSFSRGMVQRLAIARVLLADPEVLLLDEPHTGLDQEAISLLNNLILEKQRKGIAILLISHDFEQVIKVCERAIILNKGKAAESRSIDRQAGLAGLKKWYDKAVSGYDDDSL